MIDAGEKKSPTTNAFALEAMFATPMDFQFTAFLTVFVICFMTLWGHMGHIFQYAFENVK